MRDTFVFERKELMKKKPFLNFLSMQEKERERKTAGEGKKKEGPIPNQKGSVGTCQWGREKKKKHRKRGKNLKASKLGGKKRKRRDAFPGKGGEKKGEEKVAVGGGGDAQF